MVLSAASLQDQYDTMKEVIIAIKVATELIMSLMNYDIVRREMEQSKEGVNIRHILMRTFGLILLIEIVFYWWVP